METVEKTIDFFFMVWSWQNDKFYSLSHIMETDFWIEIL